MMYSDKKINKKWIEYDVAMRVPKNISSDSTTLVMGFPECGTSYFLLMQLDDDFTPLFHLLET